MWIQHAPEQGTSRRRLGARVALAAAWSALLLVVGAALQKQGFYGSVLRPWLDAGVQVPLHAWRGLGADVDRLQIDMSFRDLQRLEQQAEQALATGALLADGAGDVEAVIRVGASPVAARLRLKGDTLRPLLDGHWSFRVRTRGQGTVLGMKQFSLHHPRERNWHFEWLFHRALRREGIVALRYQFVDIVLNGRDLGVYAIEEHFDRRLLADNDRREGPVVRFSEDLMWREIARSRSSGAAPGGGSAFEAAPVDGFASADELADPLTRQEHLHAVALLESVRRGELPPSRAFDVERVAAYYALVDLLGAVHGTVWHNMRFYSNPVTGRLEPIGYDGNAGQPLRQLSGLGGDDAPADPLAALVMADEAVVRAYVRHLERMSAPEYLRGFLATVETDFAEARDALWSGYPSHDASTEVLEHNAQVIRQVLDPIKPVHAFPLTHAAGRVGLEVGNLQGVPIEITGLELEDGARLAPESAVLLPGRAPGRAAAFSTFWFSPPPGAGGSAAAPRSVLVRPAGGAGERAVGVSPYAAMPVPGLVEEAMRRAPNHESFDFLIADDEARAIDVAPGAWHLDRDLVLPAGWSLRATGGTSLQLAPGVVIVARGPLEFRGSEDQPLRIAGRGEGAALVVLQAGGGSVLRHVHFEGLGEPRRPGWTITGAVTFYESPADIRGCRFRGARAEDALNLIRSPFSLVESVFEDSAGDAVDVDFSDGLVDHCRFAGCGNDALDFCGSAVEVREVLVRGAGDKGVSCGERSRIAIRDLRVEQARLAVAAKDRSAVTLDGARVSECAYALGVYCKKPEHGPAHLEARGVSLERTPVAWLVETGSTLLVDGTAVEGDATEVAARLDAEVTSHASSR